MYIFYTVNYIVFVQAVSEGDKGEVCVMEASLMVNGFAHTDSYTVAQRLQFPAV